VPRDVLEGLLASEDMRHTHNLQGVAGCLVDLMEVPPQLVTAVDVVAGNQLFQVRTGRLLLVLQASSLASLLSIISPAAAQHSTSILPRQAYKSTCTALRLC
jgi:hypothetical protein